MISTMTTMTEWVESRGIGGEWWRRGWLRKRRRSSQWITMATRPDPHQLIFIYNILKKCCWSLPACLPPLYELSSLSPTQCSLFMRLDSTSLHSDSLPLYLHHLQVGLKQTNQQYIFEPSCKSREAISQNPSTTQLLNLYLFSWLN